MVETAAVFITSRLDHITETRIELLYQERIGHDDESKDEHIRYTLNKKVLTIFDEWS